MGVKTRYGFKTTWMPFRWSFCAHTHFHMLIHRRISQRLEIVNSHTCGLWTATKRHNLSFRCLRVMGFRFPNQICKQSPTLQFKSKQDGIHSGLIQFGPSWYAEECLSLRAMWPFPVYIYWAICCLPRRKCEISDAWPSVQSNYRRSLKRYDITIYAGVQQSFTCSFNHEVDMDYQRHGNNPSSDERSQRQCGHINTFVTWSFGRSKPATASQMRSHQHV